MVTVVAALTVLLSGSLLYLCLISRTTPPSLFLLEALWLLALLPAAAALSLPGVLRLGGYVLGACVLSASLVLVETWMVGAARLERRPDYGDVYGTTILNPGGRLRRSVTMDVVGEKGMVRWRTNADGFRNTQEFASSPASNVLRIALLGDSFVAGYRIDQNVSPGAIVERDVNRRMREAGSRTSAEVMVAVVEHPADGWLWYTMYGKGFRPAIVVLGVTIGNDFVQTLPYLDEVHGQVAIDRTGTYPRISYRDAGTDFTWRCWALPPYATEMLPPQAYALRDVRLCAAHRVFEVLALTRVGCAWTILTEKFTGSAITSWYGDGPGRVHCLDISHGLGVFLKEPAPIVEKAFGLVESAIMSFRNECLRQGCDFMVVLLPQRFQASEKDWQQTLRRYQLDARIFDRHYPNTRVRGFCVANGIRCEDLLDAFAKESKRGHALYLPRGDMHWNVAGANLAGQQIATYVWTEVEPTTRRGGLRTGRQ